jgi:predicted Zn-dependent protease
MLPVFKKLIHICIVSLVVFATALSSRAQSAWTPPPARTNKTPLAPKPHAGQNIFKDEADVWLADAVCKIEGCGTPISDKYVSQYVSMVGEYVASHSAAPSRKYQFIVTADSCPDAMNAGGGRIYLTRGMLELIESEDELAGILGHEIAHDAFAHTAKTVTRQLFWMTGIGKVKTPEEVESALEKLLEQYGKYPAAAIGDRMLWFARTDELEADRASFYNVYKAGYNPAAMSSALQRLADLQRKEDGEKEYRQSQILLFLFGRHPPDAHRKLALSWEANFVKMPARDMRFDSPGCREMKQRLNKP